MPNVPVHSILSTPPRKAGTLRDRFTVPEGPVTMADGRTLWTYKIGDRRSPTTPPVAKVFAYHDGTSWNQIDVIATPDLKGLAVARVNRLLEATGVPIFEWYHRTKSVVLNAPGQRMSTPLTVMLTLSPTGWEWEAATQSGLKAAGVTTPTLVVATSGSTTTATLTPPAPPVAPPATIPAPKVVASPPPAPPEEDKTEAEAEVVVPKGTTRKLVDPKGIFTIPSRGDTIVVSPAMKAKFERAWKAHKAGRRQVVALFGPTGSGKTQVVFDWAYANKVGVCDIDCAGMTTAMDWVGATDLVPDGQGGSRTEFVPSKLIEAIRADGQFAGIHRVVLIDEANRTESPAAINTLMAMLNSTRRIYVPDAKRSFDVDPTVMFVFTANIGSAYNATVPLDPALKSRINKKWWFDYVAQEDEVRLVKDILRGDKRYPETGPAGSTPLDRVATAMVTAARQTRLIADRDGSIPYGIGTRDLLQAATDVADGATPLEAAEDAWIGGYDREGAERSAMAIVKTAVEAVLRGIK